MPLEPFEPAWKKETATIRRTLHVVTHIRDEFLDSAGNVIKELRFEKRCLQQPITVIPGWLVRRELQQQEQQQQQQQQHQPVTQNGLQEASSSWSAPRAAITPPPQEVPKGRHYPLVAEAVEVRSPIEESIERESDDSDECSDTEDVEAVDIKKFAFWDCRKLRTSGRLKSSHARLYIPVYVFSRSSKPDKPVNVIVSMNGLKRRAAREDDLIYLRDLTPYQSIQYWKDKRIGDDFPSGRTMSERDTRTVPVIDAKLAQTGEKLDLLLIVSEPNKRTSQISFWNCALPGTASIVSHTRQPQKSALMAPEKFNGCLPSDILDKKRKKPGSTGKKPPFQQLIQDLADADEEEGSTSKRPRKSVRDPPSASSSSSVVPPTSSNTDKELEFSTLYPKLKDVESFRNLFLGFTFSKLLEKNEDTSLLEKLIRQSGGNFVPTADALVRDETAKEKCLIADKYHRSLNYARCIIDGIPIINLSWIIDCLSNKRIVPLDKERHLVKTDLLTGLKNPQPYGSAIEMKQKPFEGCCIALSAETVEVHDRITHLADGLGANFIALNLSNDRELDKQIRQATHILMAACSQLKLDKLFSHCPLDKPIVKLEWFIDCVGANRLLDYKEYVGYYYKRRNN